MSNSETYLVDTTLWEAAHDGQAPKGKAGYHFAVNVDPSTVSFTLNKNTDQTVVVFGYYKAALKQALAIAHRSGMLTSSKVKTVQNRSEKRPMPSDGVDKLHLMG